MSDVMLFGVLRMPMELAMSDEISRFQFWDRAQEALDRITELERQNAEMVAKLDNAAAPPVIEYTPGEWFHASTIEEMQAFYMSRLPSIRTAAKEHGYAIGLHGSTRRDFDLMAMQWRDDASGKDALAHAIAIAACGITRDGAYQWEKKPNGRVAVSIPICWTDHANPDFKNKLSVGHIDLSVIDLHQAIINTSDNVGADKQKFLADAIKAHSDRAAKVRRQTASAAPHQQSEKEGGS